MVASQSTNYLPDFLCTCYAALPGNAIAYIRLGCYSFEAIIIIGNPGVSDGVNKAVFRAYFVLWAGARCLNVDAQIRVIGRKQERAGRVAV